MQDALPGSNDGPMATTLNFSNVVVENFLSFSRKVSYPLHDRGVVVISGAVDGPGARAECCLFSLVPRRCVFI